MKLKDKKTWSPKTKIIVIVSVVLVLLSGGSVFAWNYFQPKSPEQNVKNEDGIDYGPATDEQTQAGYDTKEQNQSQPDVSNPDDPINLVITALNPPSDGSPNLVVRVRVDMVTSVGSCTLTLTKGGVTVTKEAGIQAGPSTSTCQGFDITGTELSSGTWNAAIKVVSGDRQGNVSQDFTVQ